MHLSNLELIQLNLNTFTYYNAMDPKQDYVHYGKIEILAKWYSYVSDWISKILSAKRHKTMKLFNIFF